MIIEMRRIRIQDGHPAFSYPPLSLSLTTALNTSRQHLVKRYADIMRGIIIKHLHPEDMQAIRRLHATEGYLELGMFEEAAEELRELDPAWFALEQTVTLQLRVLAGLKQA
jgi:hypothetical protein